MEKTKIEICGYEMDEKEVKLSGNSGRIIVKKSWVGKKVKIILLEDPGL